MYWTASLEVTLVFLVKVDPIELARSALCTLKTEVIPGNTWEAGMYVRRAIAMMLMRVRVRCMLLLQDEGRVSLDTSWLCLDVTYVCSSTDWRGGNGRGPIHCQGEKAGQKSSAEEDRWLQ